MNKFEWILYLLDSIFSLLIVLPLIVLFWGGTWSLMDHHMKPTQSDTINYIIALIIGFVANIILHCFIPKLKSRMAISNSALFCSKHFYVSRLLNYFGVIFGLLFWWGAWNLANLLVPQTLSWMIATTITSQLILLLIKCSSDAVISPFSIFNDDDQDFYSAPLRFRSNSSKPLLFIIDLITTVLCIHLLVVLLWMGLWNLGDLIIYPEQRINSYLFCLVLGSLLAVICFIIQPLIFKNMKIDDSSMERPLVEDEQVSFSVNSKKYWNLFLHDIWNVMTTVIMLILWRGSWGLAKILLFATHDHNGNKIHPANMKAAILTSLFCHFGSFILMVLLKISSTMSRAGCSIDGEEDLLKNWKFNYFTSVCPALKTKKRGANLLSEDEDTA